MKMHQMLQHSCNFGFPDWCSFVFGTSAVNLSMFTSFFYCYWTLAEAAKNASQPQHCCRMPKHEDVSTATKHLQINLPWLGGGMSLDQVKYDYLCLYQLLLLLNTGWSNQKCCPASLLLRAELGRCTNHHNIHLPWMVQLWVWFKYIYWSMSTSFYYDWTLAEAAKNAAHQHQPPQNFCK